jgi:hypothetical protein
VELSEVLKKRHIKIAVISETKKNYKEIKMAGTTVYIKENITRGPG